MIFQAVGTTMPKKGLNPANLNGIGRHFQAFVAGLRVLRFDVKPIDGFRSQANCFQVIEGIVGDGLVNIPKLADSNVASEYNRFVDDKLLLM